MTFEEFIRQADKFYTTLGVIVLIFLVIIVYLIWVDRKMTKLEKKLKK